MTVHPGRGRIEITVRREGETVFHRAGPFNIVLGLFSKWFHTTDIPVYCSHCGSWVPANRWKAHDEAHHELEEEAVIQYYVDHVRGYIE